MTEYPHTSKQFQINDQEYTMSMLPLWLISKMEDENIIVKFDEIITACTDMKGNVLGFIPTESLDQICDDIIKFSSDTSAKKGNKKAIELIAWFMNRGHLDAQYYRVDFVRILIASMEEEYKGKKQ